MRPACRAPDLSNNVRSARRRPSLLIGGAGDAVPGEPQGEQGRGGGDRQQQQYGLGPVVPQVAGGQAPHEDDLAHGGQPSSPASAPRLPLVPPVSLVSSAKAPSRMPMSRSAVAAMRESWVTMTRVCPAVCRLSNSRSTSRVDSLSR